MKLLLDVDGVLCPFPRHGADYPNYVFSEKERIWTSSDNTERVRRLMDTYEIHWFTGWMENANEVVSPIHGLPEFPLCRVLDYDECEYYHWKFYAIQAYIGRDEPYAFVDDQITDEGVEYALERTERGIPTLWLPTEAHIGLTDNHVRTLEEWANENGLGATEEVQREKSA